MRSFKQLLVLIAILSSGRAVSADCSFNLPADIPDSAPVYLYAGPNSADYQLLKPAGQQVVLPVSSKLLLACSGSGNVLRPLNTSASLVLTCSESGFLKATNDLAFKLNALTCANHPSATLRTTTTTCGQNKQGFIYDIGFEYESTKFATLFQLCYEQQNEQTLYTFNKLNGAAANFSIVQSARRSLSAAGMQYTTTATNNFYTNNNQLQRFADYFGSTQTYITSSESLVRSMLVPSGDMIFGYEQLATSFYTNAAPKFQSVNSANSMRVENLARSIATYYGREMDIYNGYMGVLQLAKLSDPKDMVAIYLDPNGKLEVPKYFFKVIRDAVSDAAIVLITMNNIYTSAADIFCTNICVEAGMNNTNFEDLKRGYTFCCELEDFKMHYKELPAEVTASNILAQPPLGSRQNRNNSQ